MPIKTILTINTGIREPLPQKREFKFFAREAHFTQVDWDLYYNKSGCHPPDMGTLAWVAIDNYTTLPPGVNYGHTISYV